MMSKAEEVVECTYVHCRPGSIRYVLSRFGFRRSTGVMFHSSCLHWCWNARILPDPTLIPHFPIGSLMPLWLQQVPHTREMHR
jgi:hypothetical protein